MIKEYGYEYDAILNEKLWSVTEGKVTKQTFDGAHCLRSGRDALKAIAREYRNCLVLLPALACDSMIHPFEMYGHEIAYYKLNKDYKIDLESLNIEATNILFLYADYFGIPSISDDCLEQLRKHGNIVFIEDRTHNYIWDRRRSFEPDYMVASLRKWIPIPDGGLLWGNISKPFGDDTRFSTTRLKAQTMRHNYLISGDERIKTEYRQIFSSVSDLMEDDDPVAMSAYSYALLESVDWGKVKRVRERNSKLLIHMLAASPYIRLIQGQTGYSDLYVAFMVRNRDEVQRRLSQERIFNTIIWPLRDIQRKTCEVAKMVELSMLAAPCDQRYTQDDMKTIGEEIVKVVADVNK